MDRETKTMLDINGENVQGVNVQISRMAGRPKLCTLWVNVDGICRLRVFGMIPDKLQVDIEKGIV